MDAQRLAQVSRIVEKIYDGDFDTDDIEILFIKIREEDGLHHTLRELADFIAHRKKDRGIVTEGALKFSYFMLNFGKHASNKESKNIVEEIFPAYFKNLILYTLNDFTEEEIKKGCNLSKEQLKKEIRKRFKFVTNDKKEYRLDLEDLEKNYMHTKKKINSIVQGINLLLGKLQCVAFHQHEVIHELTNFFEKKLPNFDKGNFIKQESKIILCIIVFLHGAELNGGLIIPGYFYIGLVNQDVNGHYHVGLYFIQPNPENTGPPAFATEAFLTTLKFSEWVEDNNIDLFRPNLVDKKIEIKPIRINKNHKLERF